MSWRSPGSVKFSSLEPLASCLPPGALPDSHPGVSFNGVCPAASESSAPRHRKFRACFGEEGTPDEGVAAPEGTLVIWGGATSVGMAAVQFARAARVSSIIAIASSKRHEYLKILGATQSFDYNDTDVIEKVKSALQSTSGTIWAFDALGSPESQVLLKKAIPQHDRTVLASVLLGGDPEYKAIMGARRFDVEFELPGGQKVVWPKDMAAADRHWRGFRWAVENYGAPGGYVPAPVRVFEGSGEDAIKEVYNVKNMSTFGKLVLKHPLK
ncbi:hypothetical protein FOC4_g10009636 [Fusarium odoratissimum]|uniref:Alcohol dehydrogenase-like C-terminal domain-containing protein n=1 Tax=Fusarium oxysporum f. sp. cubense (strain race 4) TaxID=2502994 RepID=N1S0H1_FUSC4|nr:hypothetical protein FOC4_g10009636 [Fusarium odoratissimum]